MARLTKKQKEAVAKIEKSKFYSLNEASSLIKEISNSNFDASVDIAVRLGVDPKKANQMVRGVVALPHGTGKELKVLALVTADKEAEAKEVAQDNHEALMDFLQDHDDRSSSVLENIAGRVRVLEQWRWVVLGGGAAILYLLSESRILETLS